MASELDPDWTDGVNFLANRPLFLGQCTGQPSIGPGVFAPVVLDTNVTDTWNGQAPLGATPQEYWCQAAGWYVCEAFMPFAYTGATESTFGAAVTAVTAGGTTTYQGQMHPDSSGQNPGAYACDLIRLARAGTIGAPAADHVHANAYTSGAPGAVSLQGAGAAFPYLAARWAGIGTASSLSVPANQSFPAPPAFLGTAWCNQNIRDTVSFLANPPLLRWAAPGTGGLVSTTWPTPGTISLTSRAVDTYLMFGTATATGTVPAAAPGVYFAHCQVSLSQVPSSNMVTAAGLSVNGTVTWGQAVRSDAAASGTIAASLTGRFRLSAGDVFALAGFVSAGGGTATVQAASKLILVWESA